MVIEPRKPGGAPLSPRMRRLDFRPKPGHQLRGSSSLKTANTLRYALSKFTPKNCANEMNRKFTEF